MYVASRTVRGLRADVCLVQAREHMNYARDIIDPPVPSPGPNSRSRTLRVLGGAGRFVLDWLPIFIVLVVYDAIHHRIGVLLPPAHTWPQIHADEAFGLPIPTVRLQRALYTEGHPHWWDFASLAVYTSHFVVALAIALALWIRSRARYLRFMAWFIGMTTAGYAIYVLFPAVPPWLASQNGDLVPTHRIVRELWEYLGFHNIAELFSGSGVYANDIAAIPSLHAAYPLMIAIIYWKVSGWLMRSVLALYVLWMGLALVYCAEHYVVDILLGWLLAVLTALAMRRLWPATPVPRGLGSRGGEAEGR